LDPDESGAEERPVGADVGPNDRMNFALTTHWNARRHVSGEAMLEEIAALGFEGVELGYDLRLELVEGVRKVLASGALRATSVHCFCPVPLGVARAHPELFLPASRDERERQSAVEHIRKTVIFAAEVGARFAVCHAGRVDGSAGRLSRELLDLVEAGEKFSPKYDRLKMKLQIEREKRAGPHLELLRRSIEELLPTLESCGVTLAFENLPSWDAIPTEFEMEELAARVGSRRIGYWHDLGHGQIRENMGFINHHRWLERLRLSLVGMHVHDVIPPAGDHAMPPRGSIDFDRFREVASGDIVRVLEPATRTPPEEIREALAFLRKTWTGGPDSSAQAPSDERKTP
jgi:sugar phosphate isomerase/epimerase